MKSLTIDIETIPNQDPEFRERIAETIKHPGNMKNADTIANWKLTQKPQAIDDALLKTSLNGAYGEIISFSHAIDDGDVKGIIRTLDDPESQLIEEICNIISITAPAQIRFVGHNIVKFDNRFIFQRALKHQVTIPVDLMAAISARPNDFNRNFDTMLFWGGAYKNEYISVHDLCYVFDVESPKKGDLDGSKVWEYIQAGKYDEVLIYNKRDVSAERELAFKMGANQLIDINQYRVNEY